MAEHLADYLEASARRFPERVAIVESTGTSTTYAELNRQADALAGFLSASGVRRGDRVGVVLPKSIAAVLSFFAVMKAGAAYVPVDFSAPAERSRRILTDCEISALVVDRRALGVVPAPTNDDALRAIVAVGSADDDGDTPSALHVTPLHRALSGAPAPFIQRSPGDLAYIIYTSGSTGVPKGAMISQANALSFVEWCSELLEPTEDDRFSSHTPFHFDPSVQDIYVSVKNGATLYLISEELARNFKELAAFIAHHRLTLWTSTPSTLIMLMQFGNLDVHDASSIRAISFGGEVFPVKHLRELTRRWPHPVYYNMYGPTEATTASAFARIPAVIPDDREVPYPIGFPCSHCRALVLDEHGDQVAQGEAGLLHIAGPNVFSGYWNRPVETAAALVERDGVRWYNTGDVVRWDPVEGFTYLGRRDRMVKRRGFRIELGEVERALSAHPKVTEAAVLSVPDPDSGIRIVAFLACGDATRPTIVELKTFCATKLPTYMSPDRFVIQDRLPRTSTDKVDYQSLKDLL